VDRGGVADDVQVIFSEINNAIAIFVLNEGIADVPFFGNRPVKNARAGWYFVDLERNVFAEDLQCLAHAVTSEAPAYRKKPCCQRVKRGANFTIRITRRRRDVAGLHSLMLPS